MERVRHPPFGDSLHMNSLRCKASPRSRQSPYPDASIPAPPKATQSRTRLPRSSWHCGHARVILNEFLKHAIWATGSKGAEAFVLRSPSELAARRPRDLSAAGSARRPRRISESRGGATDRSRGKRGWNSYERQAGGCIPRFYGRGDGADRNPVFFHPSISFPEFRLRPDGRKWSMRITCRQNIKTIRLRHPCAGR